MANKVDATDRKERYHTVARESCVALVCFFVVSASFLCCFPFFLLLFLLRLVFLFFVAVLALIVNENNTGVFKG